jgi:hypothetical protein
MNMIANAVRNAMMGQETQDGPTEEELKAQEDERLRSLQKLWLRRIKNEERDHKDFRDRGKEISDVYEDDIGGKQLYVPLLWSVVQVEHSGIYSSQPVPDIRPNNDDNNPIFEDAAQVLDRGIGYYADQQSFDACMHRAVDDFLVRGLGIPRLKVESEIVEQEGAPVMTPGPPIMTPMGPQPGPPVPQPGEMEKAVGNQSMRWSYTPWNRFGWEPCNSWDDCDFIYFRHPMTQAQCKKRFGQTVKGSKNDGVTSHSKEEDKIPPTVDIYEVWDRDQRKVLFLAKGESKPLEVNDDPLGLTDFYPCPPPMMSNIAADELVPQADYDFIEPYDVELNKLQGRRMALLDQLKASGVYDEGLPELSDILELDDGQMKPIPNLLSRLQGHGFDNSMFFLPLEEKIRVIDQLTQQIAFVKAQVDEILGISDIVRGVSNAKEGVGTQELKGRWVGIRLSRKRDVVQFTIREMFRLMAQVLANIYTDENLTRLTQLEINEQVTGLLRNDLMMDFAIDIETESTVAKDEFQERASRQEMLGSLGAYTQSVLPAVQQGLMPADVSSAVLRAALAPYTKYDKSLDEAMNGLQTTQQQLQQLTGQLQQVNQAYQQCEAEKNHWMTIAQTLQYQATQAKAAQQTADAGKKQAETQKIRAETPDEHLQPIKTVAEIANIEADTMDKRRPGPRGM